MKYCHHLILDLLCSHPVNNGVKSRGDDHIQIIQEDVDITWNIVSKSMSHKGEKGWSEESQNDTHMGTTGMKSFESGLLGWESEDSM